MQKITTCLTFNNQAEEAMNFYLSVFKDSQRGDIMHYGEGAPLPAGTFMTGTFQLKGMNFMVLNAGSDDFKFAMGTSFMINCKDQAEIDWFWDKLSEGGETQACGWLRDKYGLSWQVVPESLAKMMADKEKAPRVLQAVWQMIKLDLAKLEEAYTG